MKRIALFALIPAALFAADRPNTIHIMVDDAGIGDFGCYGEKEIHTPNIDRLAAEGMRFTRAYSGNAVCSPTRDVLMTGRHPGHCLFRANRATRTLPDDTVTVAEAMKAAGYATGGFGLWWSSPRTTAPTRSSSNPLPATAVYADSSAISPRAACACR